MLRSAVLSVMLTGAMCIAANQSIADDSSAAPPGPSPATLKKARLAGLHPETKDGVTRFCWEDANSGSHFKTKKCVNEDGLEDVLAQRQAAKDEFQRGSQCGGCGGSK